MGRTGSSVSGRWYLFVTLLSQCMLQYICYPFPQPATHVIPSPNISSTHHCGEHTYPRTKKHLSLHNPHVLCTPSYRRRSFTAAWAQFKTCFYICSYSSWMLNLPGIILRSEVWIHWKRTQRIQRGFHMSVSMYLRGVHPINMWNKMQRTEPSNDARFHRWPWLFGLSM